MGLHFSLVFGPVALFIKLSSFHLNLEARPREGNKELIAVRTRALVCHFLIRDGHTTSLVWAGSISVV